MCMAGTIYRDILDARKFLSRNLRNSITLVCLQSTLYVFSVSGVGLDKSCVSVSWAGVIKALTT